MKHSRGWLRGILPAGLLSGLAVLSLCFSAGAQSDPLQDGTAEAPAAAPVSPDATGTGIRAPGAQPQTPRAVGEPATEMPYTSLFRNTNITPTSANIQVGVAPAIHTDPFEFQFTNLKLGESGGLGIPFIHRGFEPQNCTLKLGPVFIKIWRVEGDTLFSDNINLTQTNRKAGVIAIIRMDIGVICQLGENFQLAIAGSLVYLPLQGKFGPAGYGLGALMGGDATGAGTAVLSCQATYDTMIAGWNVQFFDQLDTGTVNYSNSILGNTNGTLLQGADFPWVDRAGVYSFGAPNSKLAPGSNSSYRTNTADDNQQYLSNTVGVQITRLIASDTRLSVRAIQQNLWYNSNGRGMPSTRDSVDASLVSYRENLRFKPFITYSATWVNPGNTFFQHVSLGAFGPITDLLDFYGSMGFYEGSNGGESLLWYLQLKHTAGPNTTEKLVFFRDVNLFDQEMSTVLGYSLSQVLGPSISAELHVMGERVEDFSGGSNTFNELLAGVTVSYFVSPRTDIAAGVDYEYQYYTNYDQYLSVWTGHAELDYHFTDTLTGKIYYRYRNRNTNIPRNGYYENMVFLSLSKSFP